MTKRGHQWFVAQPLLTLLRSDPSVKIKGKWVQRKSRTRPIRRRREKKFGGGNSVQQHSLSEVLERKL